MIKTFDFDFLQNTLRQLELYNLSDKKLGLAVSGGEDSMVLLNHVLKIKKKQNIFIGILHVHHGLTADEKTNAFRNQAKAFVQKVATENNLPFFTNEVLENKNSSEENLRNIRLSFFSQLKKENVIDVVVTAHHRMDLLETRMIRLMRGSGPQGLEAMSAFENSFFRPILNWDKSFIQNYVEKENVEFLVDPSNSGSKYFRNWIRNDLLPKMQDYRPGSVESLSRSLELIVDKIKQTEPVENLGFSENGIDRLKLLKLTKQEQRSLIAHYLHELQINAYSHSHIDEILKRLDSSQKELTFDLLGCKWTANSSCVAAIRTIIPKT